MASPAGDEVDTLGSTEGLATASCGLRADTNDWQRDLGVSLDVPGLKEKLAAVAQVQDGSGIR
jgi:hypothetical protein